MTRRMLINALCFSLAFACCFTLGTTLKNSGDQRAAAQELNAAESGQADSGEAGQDAPAAASAGADWQEQLAQWDEVSEQLRKLQAEYLLADDANKRILRVEFEARMTEARKLLESLREAAIKAYEAAPNENEDLTKLLIGLLVNDASMDDTEQAFELGQMLIDHQVSEEMLTAARNANRLGLKQREIIDELLARRTQQLSGNKFPQATITVEDADGNAKGDIVVELFEDQAPNTVANFVSLAEKGFYNGLSFHRVIKGFMAQGGDPKGDGTGGPGYTFEDELDRPDYRRHFPYSLSMANNGPDTNGSQFFITFRRTSNLDGKHTVFGRVIAGKDVVDSIRERNTDAGSTNLPAPDKIKSITIDPASKRDHEYVPVTVPEEKDPPAGEGEEAASDKSDDAKSDDAKSDGAKADDTQGGDNQGSDNQGSGNN